MIVSFEPYAYSELKNYISNLLDAGKSFSVRLIVDTNNNPNRWEVEEN